MFTSNNLRNRDASAEFTVTVGLHERSALDPFLFVVVLDKSQSIENYGSYCMQMIQGFRQKTEDELLEGSLSEQYLDVNGKKREVIEDEKKKDKLNIQIPRLNDR